LASFNILHGRSLDGSPVPVDRLASACASLEADVLCIQEVDRGQARSDGVDQTGAVGEAMGAIAWRFQPALVGEPGGDWRVADDADDIAGGDIEGGDIEGGDIDGGTRVSGRGSGSVAGGYGVGLVSRWPVAGWRVLRLAPAPVRSPVYVPGQRGVILLADEPRVALVADIDTPAGRLVVATTHLSFVPGWNVVQLRRVTRDLAARGGASVLVGDLNLPGPVPRWASGWRSLARLPTFPVDRPMVQIDHVLAHGPVPEVTAVAAHRLPLSDHRALVVDLA